MISPLLISKNQCLFVCVCVCQFSSNVVEKENAREEEERTSWSYE